MDSLHQLEFPLPRNQNLTVYAGINLSFAVRQNESAGCVPKHKHIYDEILFSPTGLNSIDWWCQNSGDRSYVLRAGDAIWTPHGVEHAATWHTSWYNIGIAISPHIVADVCLKSGIERPTSAVRFGTSSDLQKLISICLGPRGQAVLEIEPFAASMANVIAALAINDYKLQKPIVESSMSCGFDEEQKCTVEAYIASNLYKTLQVAELASCLKLSRFHFARLFKDSYGVAPHQYITALRLEQVRSLLTKSNLSVHEVALKAGFSSSDHLCKVFKNKYGITPSAYKARQMS